MVFSTQFFLFVFFPLSLTCYLISHFLQNHGPLRHFLAKIRLSDLIVVLFSLEFYKWACFDDLIKLVTYILAVYMAGRMIQVSVARKRFIKIYQGSDETTPCKKFPLSVIPFAVFIGLALLCLIHFKYTVFLSEITNALFRSGSEPASILAPLGISFITFSTISYLTDIYRGNAQAGSLLDCALFLSFFPKVVSGPIVLWKQFQPQIPNRKVNLDRAVFGLNRIMIGFAKKVILADQFGACLASIEYTNIDSLTALGTVVLYTLQIYYDFAGYSDIAIGLCALFGFEVEENFNFPYRSKSISEFWRRWHISLGTWFREYVYFPLGGSRVSTKKTLRNLGIVFLLTGIWHGASWNYIIWGCLNGLFVLIERLIQQKPFYKKIPSVFKHIVTMLIVMICWQYFRFEELETMQQCWNIILGKISFERIPYTWMHYYNARIITLMSLGILGATLLGSPHIQKYYKKFSETTVGYCMQQVILLVLFFTAILFMINSTYSPFLYFQY